MFRYILQSTLQKYFAYLGSAEYIFAVIYFFSNTPSTFFFFNRLRENLIFEASSSDLLNLCPFLPTQAACITEVI